MLASLGLLQSCGGDEDEDSAGGEGAQKEKDLSVHSSTGEQHRASYRGSAGVWKAK